MAEEAPDDAVPDAEDAAEVVEPEVAAEGSPEGMEGESAEIDVADAENEPAAEEAAEEAADEAMDADPAAEAEADLEADADVGDPNVEAEEAEAPEAPEEAQVEGEPGEDVYIPLEPTEEELQTAEGIEEQPVAEDSVGDELGRGQAEPEEEEEAEKPEEEEEGVDDEGEAELERQLNDEEEEEDAEPIEDGPDPMLELQEKMAGFLDQNEKLKGKNAALQRALINRRAQDKSYDASEKQSEGKVTQHKYENMLNNVHSERMKLRLQQVMAARMSDELKNQLEAKRQKAIECRDSFQEFKRQIARHAEYARTGKKIQEKIIQEVEEFELDKDAEVEEVRGSNISLKNRLAKLEQALRNKDELAENLHVIDFEQLKIENQQLNEKIEERNEELHKLRKKTIVTVQIITHMREKVQFVQKEYQILKEELAQLDQDLGAQRDLVTKTKHERDEHRQEYASLKQQTGIMNSEHLTKDFKERADRIKELKEQITQLKKRHTQMSQFIKSHGGQI